jgi:DNA-binding MarR family transcriptional regulator
MTPSTEMAPARASSTDQLVETLAIRMRRMDLVGWQSVTTWAEQSGLSFEDLRMLLALALKIDDDPVAVSELAGLAGFSLNAAYPAVHRLQDRGYVREDRRRYALSPRGQQLVAGLDTARREGIQAYVGALDREERARLLSAFGETR